MHTYSITLPNINQAFCNPKFINNIYYLEVTVLRRKFMDNSLIEKYKKELLDMHNKKIENPPVDQYGDNGKLIVNVTTLRQLYPVVGAKVTIFTDDLENMNIIDTSTTDQSGRSKVFMLPAPNRNLSLEVGADEPVYSSYGVLVEADGYANEVNLNLPIFRGVTSLQNVDLTLLSAQNGKTININDQAENYNL